MDIVERLVGVGVGVLVVVILVGDTSFAGLGRVERGGPQGVVLVEGVDLRAGDAAPEDPGGGGEVQLPQVGPPGPPFLDGAFLEDVGAEQQPFLPPSALLPRVVYLHASFAERRLGRRDAEEPVGGRALRTTPGPLGGSFSATENIVPFASVHGNGLVLPVIPPVTVYTLCVWRRVYCMRR